MLSRFVASSLTIINQNDILNHQSSIIKYKNKELFDFIFNKSDYMAAKLNDGAKLDFVPPKSEARLVFTTSYGIANFYFASRCSVQKKKKI